MELMQSRFLNIFPFTKKQAESLKKLRIIQTNKIHVQGIPRCLINIETLKAKRYFGQYGAIKDISLSIKIDDNKKDSFSVYIAYENKMEAACAILCVDSIFFFRKIIRAFFGTTKYCKYFLNNQKCANPEKCEFLHRLAPNEDIIFDDKNGFSFKEHLNLSKKIVEQNYSEIKNILNKPKKFKSIFPWIDFIFLTEEEKQEYCIRNNYDYIKSKEDEGIDPSLKNNSNIINIYNNNRIQNNGLTQLDNLYAINNSNIAGNFNEFSEVKNVNTKNYLDPFELYDIFKNSINHILFSKHFFDNMRNIPFKKLDANINLNIYILLFIENVLNSERVDQTNYKFFSLEIIKKTKNYIEPDKKNIFNCHTLLKEINNSNNLVVNIWSILYLVRDSNSYLNKFLIKLENDIFSLFLYFENEILKEDSKTFANKVDIIINISKDLKNILENDTFLVNLLKNENYTKDMNKDYNSIDERKRILNDLKNEKNKIDSFLKNKNIQNVPKIRKLFNKYMEILNNDINRIEEEIKTLEIQDYKERIEKTVKSEFEPKLGESLLKNMEIKNTIEELKEFEKLINNYKIKYIDENEEKINIFSNIVLSDDILEEVYKNKYVNLIEILLKYSKLKDKIEEITNNKKNKLVSLQELNKNTDLIYYDFFNSFLLSKEINENDINTVNQFLDAKYFWK